MNAMIAVRCFFPPPPLLHLGTCATWRRRLRIAIERSGKTQSVVSREAGIDPSTLSRILNGHIRTDFETIARLAHAVNENVGWLLDERGFTLSAEEQKEVRKVARFLDDAAAGRMTDRERLQPNAVPSGSDVPRAFTARGAQLVYEALGDSMRGAGILDRDLLFVRPTRSMREAAGRIVVCRIDAAEYVKVLDVRGGRISLLSRNERHPPIDVPEERFELVGIVLGRGGTIG